MQVTYCLKSWSEHFYIEVWYSAHRLLATGSKPYFDKHHFTSFNFLLRGLNLICWTITWNLQVFSTSTKWKRSDIQSFARHPKGTKIKDWADHLLCTEGDIVASVQGVQGPIQYCLQFWLFCSFCFKTVIHKKALREQLYKYLKI